MSKILLLGGTGAMGVYLRRILAADGHSVMVTSRKQQSGNRQVTFLRGDARDVGFLTSVLNQERPDAIVDFMIYGTDEFRARRDLLLSKTCHYIFLSSYRVFDEDNVLTEQSPRLLDSSKDDEYLRTDEYALCKARSENLLRCADSSNWSIVRPAITYSTGRFQLGCLEANVFCYRSFLGLPVAMPSQMRRCHTTMTWGKDVALMISRLILNPNAFGEDFNCTTSEHHTWDEVCGLYKEIIGTDVRDCSIADYIKVCGNQAQVRYDRMFDRVLDNTKILAVSGLKQSDLTSLKKGLANELEDFRKIRDQIIPDIRINAGLDRILGTRIPLVGLPLRRKLYYYSVLYPEVGLLAKSYFKLKRTFCR